MFLLRCGLLNVIFAAVSASSDGCSSFSSCSACIRAPGCYWCPSPIGGASQCVHEYTNTKCEGLSKKKITVLQNDQSKAQISPQHASVKLRVGELITMNVTYSKLDDYPVDLYYLMDMSASMKKKKENLAKLGSYLATHMRKITSNFHLGFGSFVDKVALPFVNTAPSKINNPCNKDAPCARAYSFKNHMALSTDEALFTKRVRDTELSGNVDSPEGGFDALMQAMVCTDQINWRPDARHLLIFATDAIFHIAGDGKLAGVVEPNDEKCHMNEKNEYTHDLIYDYPSISQISRKARENNINIIFTVTEGVQEVYNSLTNHITGSQLGILNETSNNVIDLILQLYSKLVETVKIVDNSVGKGIEIRYKSSCLNKEESDFTNVCHNVHAKTPVTFEVALEVKSCPEDFTGEVWSESIKINPYGVNETFQVDLEVQCGCGCEQRNHTGYETNSTYCNSHGTLMCGVCSCEKGWTGQFCECLSDAISGKENTDACITDNETQTICNGRGSCQCGICKCYKRQNKDEHVYGKHCECDDFSCLRHEGKVCSGPERGRCQCGQCECQPGRNGDACQCPNTNAECIAPGDEKVCSGFGTCQCGKCVCKSKDQTGKFCGDCPTCPGGRCKEFGDCVECLVHNSGKYVADSCIPCDIQNITILDTIRDAERNQNEQLCKLPDEAGCSFVYTYLELNGDVIIKAEKNKECPIAVNLLGLVLGVVGGTVLLGLLIIIIWKILTTIHDRREYERFEKERAMSKWDTGNNPLYVQATSTFSNPTFGGK